MTYTTSKSTQAEIVAEAQAITDQVRSELSGEISDKIRTLKKETALSWAWSVKQARFRLEIIDRSGKGVNVIAKSDFLPFYEFHAYMMAFKHEV